MADETPSAAPAIVALHVKVSAGTKALPPPAVGAYVTAFSMGPDVQTAAERSAKALTAMGLTVDEIVPKALMIPFDAWDQFVAREWAKAPPHHFPSGADMPGALFGGRVVLSPFAGFNTFKR